MNNSYTNIGLACGGTGGHISPALAISTNFKDYKLKPIFFTDNRGSNILDAYCYFVIASGSPSIKGFRKIVNLIKLILGIFQAIYLLYKNRIKLVIGFGGYTCVPVILAAWLLRIPSIIHEQNKILGRANKFCAKFCKKIALSFDIKNKDFYPTKTILTGNPVLNKFEIIGNKKYSPAKNNKFVLLIIGGSQGANIFSKIIPNSIRILPKKIRDNILIIQQCREEDQVELIGALKKIGVEFIVEKYFKDIDKIFERSDLIISRSGASTVCEILASRRPSILIPLPNSLDNHQFQNAFELTNHQASQLIEQKDFSANNLSKILKEYISNKQILLEMADNARLIYKGGSSKKIINLVLSTVKGSNR